MKKILIFLVLFLTGCYNYTELNNLAIVKWASIDFENNEYILNYAVNENEKITILEGKGASISDAVADMNLSSPKEIYIGHMLVYVISEDVAKNGISKVTDYFFRNPSSKKTFQIMIAKNSKAKEILRALSSFDDKIIKNLTDETSLSSFTINTTLLSFIKKVKDPGIETTASGIKVIDEKTIKIEPLAIFKNDKFIEWADEEFSKGITILYNQTNISKINASCKNGKVTFTLSDLNVKYNFKNSKFKIKITANSEINEMTCNYDLQNLSDLKELEDLLIKSLTSILNNTIQKIKKSKIDSVGLGYFIYQNDYKHFKNDYLDNLDVEFEVIPNLLAFENNNEGVIKIGE